MTDTDTESLDLAALTGIRRGPYRSFNAVSRVQVWQWCSAMGDRNPLYLDDHYRHSRGLGDRVIAPPAMMQMWTMRDVHMQFAPGSTGEPPYAVFDTLHAHGFTSNVAVSYDIRFHRLLEEGDGLLGDVGAGLVAPPFEADLDRVVGGAGRAVVAAGGCGGEDRRGRGAGEE